MVLPFRPFHQKKKELVVLPFRPFHISPKKKFFVGLTQTPNQTRRKNPSEPYKKPSRVAASFPPPREKKREKKKKKKKVRDIFFFFLNAKVGFFLSPSERLRRKKKHARDGMGEREDRKGLESRTCSGACFETGILSEGIYRHVRGRSWHRIATPIILTQLLVD